MAPLVVNECDHISEGSGMKEPDQLVTVANTGSLGLHLHSLSSASPGPSARSGAGLGLWGLNSTLAPCLLLG